MEGSKIGVVRVLRNEICHRWWHARVSGKPRLLGNGKVIRGHSFRIREEVQFDAQTV